MTREEAIYILKNSAWLGTDEMVKAIDMAIEALSAEAVQGWIPCSERLPSKAEHRDDMVLVCYGNGSIRFNTYMNGWVQGFPIAWMPLPTPYQGGDTE